MKKLITAIAVSVLAFAGTAINADARPWYERGHPHPNASPNYRGNYHHDHQVHTQRYVAGYDYHGRPIYRVRTVPAPRYDYHRGAAHCAPVYRSGYRPHYSRSHGYHGYHGSRYGSHSSISFSFSR